MGGRVRGGTLALWRNLRSFHTGYQIGVANYRRRTKARSLPSRIAQPFQRTLRGSPLSLQASSLSIQTQRRAWVIEAGMITTVFRALSGGIRPSTPPPGAMQRNLRRENERWRCQITNARGHTLLRHGRVASRASLYKTVFTRLSHHPPPHHPLPSPPTLYTQSSMPNRGSPGA